MFGLVSDLFLLLLYSVALPQRLGGGIQLRLDIVLDGIIGVVARVEKHGRCRNMLFLRPQGILARRSEAWVRSR